MGFVNAIIKDNKKAIVDHIFSEDMKAKIVAKLNDAVDVPFISEATEAKVIDAMYSSIEDVVKEAILEKI